MATTSETPARNIDAEITKYKVAAEIVHSVMQKLVAGAVEGKKVLDLVIEGDEALEAGAAGVYNKKAKGAAIQKGIAFPTCISVNNAVAHFSPLKSDPQSDTVLAKGDVVKIQLGAHIDGYAATSAETLIVGATEDEPATGRAADVVKAAWTAAEAAMRHLKVGEKNYGVTEIVDKVTAIWDCKPVENMLSCQYERNVIDGKKKIILNPGEQQRRDVPNETFGENEVYGIDILVVSAADGKASYTQALMQHANRLQSRSEDSRCTIYQRVSDVNYQLKMKTSRAVFSEAQKKSGAFPFNIRCLEDEKKARMGLQEAVQHGLVREYPIAYTAQGTYVAGFTSRSPYSPPPIWYKPEKVKTEKEVQDEQLKELLVRPLRESKKDKKAKKKAEKEDEE
ncbi:Curved DNA-binding protein AltName: Full=42 kDa protein [Serendipita indica DSM 11827]|nr:Curved DNA-binding protein AltName: Full=42 kDa protein [Serendipita indica DSM 11827]